MSDTDREHICKEIQQETIKKVEELMGEHKGFNRDDMLETALDALELVSDHFDDELDKISPLVVDDDDMEV